MSIFVFQITVANIFLNIFPILTYIYTNLLYFNYILNIILSFPVGWEFWNVRFSSFFFSFSTFIACARGILFYFAFKLGLEENAL